MNTKLIKAKHSLSVEYYTLVEQRVRELRIAQPETMEKYLRAEATRQLVAEGKILCKNS